MFISSLPKKKEKIILLHRKYIYAYFRVYRFLPEHDCCDMFIGIGDKSINKIEIICNQMLNRQLHRNNNIWNTKGAHHDAYLTVFYFPTKTCGWLRIAKSF